LSKLVEGNEICEYDCGHNDFPMDSDRYWQDVMGFLQGSGVLPDDDPAGEARPLAVKD
jgi:hypothetical protein